jgi:dihydropteroate synthase
MLRELDHMAALDAPLLVGVSRKRMINEVLGTTPTEALNGTSVVNTLALMGGAAVLRVHDVREALEVVRLWEAFKG